VLDYSGSVSRRVASFVCLVSLDAASKLAG